MSYLSRKCNYRKSSATSTLKSSRIWLHSSCKDVTEAPCTTFPHRGFARRSFSKESSQSCWSFSARHARLGFLLFEPPGLFVCWVRREEGHLGDIHPAAWGWHFAWVNNKYRSVGRPWYSANYEVCSSFLIQGSVSSWSGRTTDLPPLVHFCPPWFVSWARLPRNLQHHQGWSERPPWRSSPPRTTPASQCWPER